MSAHSRIELPHSQIVCALSLAFYGGTGWVAMMSLSQINYRKFSKFEVY